MVEQSVTANSWDFGETKEDLIHKIHPYPAKFPSFITTKALSYAEDLRIKVENVADIFCGCGTSAVEAKKNGRNYLGCDINPVATLIAEVKTHRYLESKLETKFNQILEQFVKRPRVAKNLPINERLIYWYGEDSLEDLFFLKQAIKQNTRLNSYHQKFFLCAFSAILKPTSYWLSKSIKPHKDKNKKPKNVIEAFNKQVLLMRRANMNNFFPIASAKTKIMTKSFLELNDCDGQANLIVTSPPYLTSYDYADIHQLSILWLGYLSDYRQLRKNMLGNKYGAKTPNLDQINNLSDTARETYWAMNSLDPRQASSIAKYYIGLEKAVCKCWNLLTDPGIAVFVIGNTNCKDLQIKNARILEEYMLRVGFQPLQKIKRQVSLKSIPSYRDEFGRFTKVKSHRKVYAEEFVLIGVKSRA